MEMANCAKCKKIFPRVNSPICENCQKEEERLFESVKSYLDDHRSCTIEEISRETGASAKKIMGYLRDGRLQISDGMGGTLHCQACGKPISSGNYCDACVIDINQQVSSMIEDSHKRNQGMIMHAKLKEKEKEK